jgi:arylsulfatase A-like enzyme
MISIEGRTMTMRRVCGASTITLLISALGLWLTVVSGCGSSSETVQADLIAAAEGKNILIVLVDAAALHHFSCYGYDRATTPRIDELAADAFVLDNAYAQSSGTMLSTYSYFTSRYPMFGRRPIKANMVVRIPPKLTTIAEFMADRYDHRLGATANTWLKESQGHAQGTTQYIESWKLPQHEDGTEAGDPELAAASLDWMLDCADEPFYAYVHLLRPHSPYDSPEPYASRFTDHVIDPERGSLEYLKAHMGAPLESDILTDIVALYDGGLSHVDALVGDILDGLDATGQLENTIVILMSDHGQCHWEDGHTFGHGGTVREETVRVPWIIRIPGIEGHRIQAPVELVDLLPTLLELTKIEQGGIKLAGQSLLPLMTGEPGDANRTIMTRTNRRDPPIHAMIEGRWKLVWEVGTDLGQLYDLEADPICLHDLTAAGDSLSFASKMTARLKGWLEQSGHDGHILSSQPFESLDPAAKKRLQALGY